MRSPRRLAATHLAARHGDRRILHDLNLHVDRGETVGLRGPSGCGKSTLVRVLALLHRPDHGAVTLDGTPIRGARHAVPAGVRTRIAPLFQSPRAAADPRLGLLDLIAEPLRATGTAQKPARARARDLAERVGLTPDLLGRRPHAVSDGQLQRACLARALIHRPEYLLCDEATAMLDASTQALVADVLRDHQRRHDTGILLVSHDTALLDRWADRQLTWADLTG